MFHVNILSYQKKKEHKEKPKHLERLSSKKAKYSIQITSTTAWQICLIYISSSIYLESIINLTTLLYYLKMSNNPGDGKNPRRARKPQGFFSEKQQEQRNEAARGQLEVDLPI